MYACAGSRDQVMMAGLDPSQLPRHPSQPPLFAPATGIRTLASSASSVSLSHAGRRVPSSLCRCRAPGRDSESVQVEGGVRRARVSLPGYSRVRRVRDCIRPASKIRSVVVNDSSSRVRLACASRRVRDAAASAMPGAVPPRTAESAAQPGVPARPKPPAQSRACYPAGRSRGRY